MTMHCEVEEFNQDGQLKMWNMEVDETSVVSSMAALQMSWSTTLWLRAGSQRLAISFSEGLAALMLSVGENDFYDFIGDPGAAGWTEFVHGGEPAEHPRRHCATLDQAASVAQAFVRDESIVVDSQRWELQGTFQSA